MKLSNYTITAIKHTIAHELEVIEGDMALEHELTELLMLCSDIPFRFAIEIKRTELVPDTTNTIVNIMASHIIDLYERDEDTVEAENAIWEYLKETYLFDTEDHNLLKATFEEALTYAIDHIGISK